MASRRTAPGRPAPPSDGEPRAGGAGLVPLEPQALRRRCDEAWLPFTTTADLEDLPQAIGQERAAESLRFGLGIRREGYHLFAMGPAESGKRTFVRRFLEERARGEPVPEDVCYAHNFRDPHRPRALRLPCGRGRLLRDELERAIEDLRVALPAAVDSEEQRNRRQAIEDEVKERQEAAVAALKEEARSHRIALVHTPLGFGFAPTHDGEVVSPARYETLSEDERRQIEQEIEGWQERLKAVLEQAHAWEHEARGKVRELVAEVTRQVVHGHLDGLRERYADLPAVRDHLTDVEADLIENAADLFRSPEGAAASLAVALQDLGMPPRLAAVRRYLLHLFIEHAPGSGAPVVYEDGATFERLLGRIEHLAQLGALVTDFHLVQPGALHRANGGYLVLEAHDVLTQPFAWDALKRALRSHEVRMESLGQRLGLLSTVTLEPEPIPLDVKVVLLGERLLYYLLVAYDPEFASLFKVAVDFEEDVPRTPEAALLYARLVGTVARREGLRDFDRGGVAAVVERSARLAGDAEKLSTHMGSVANLLREADWWANESGRGVVGAADVHRAVEAAERRAGRVRERVLEEIRRGTILIDTSGSRVGQVNGLSVVQMGEASFGRPSRITARVRMGTGEVVDVEREVELGGPTHSKGVLILAGFLASRYATEHPLSLRATLVFEQSYGPVEGDSASSAELYALLSSLAEVPVRQALAVTGSVDQHGRVQPIGGVNDKVEGFFDACAARGLTGEQGVLVPAGNVKHLMLRPDVVEAVRAGRFRVWAVETVDQGIELLTGVPAGVRGADGRFPEGTVNRRVEDRLVAMAERRRAFGAVARLEGGR